MAAIQGPFTEKKRNGGKKIRPSSQWSGDFGPNSWKVVSLTLFILGRDYENEYVPKLPNYSWTDWRILKLCCGWRRFSWNNKQEALIWKLKPHCTFSLRRAVYDGIQCHCTTLNDAQAGHFFPDCDEKLNSE